MVPQSCIYANIVLFTSSYGGYFSGFVKTVYLIWALVDQLNKILEILGAFIAKICLCLISD